MALIKCPECGKEISDKAEICPNCGFGIRKHLEQQRQIQAKKIETNRREKAKQQLVNEENIAIQQMANRRITPKIKPFLSGALIAGLLCLLMGIMCIILAITAEGYAFAIFIGIFMVLAGIVYSGMGIEKLREKRKLYDQYKNDIEKYKQEVIRYEISEEKHNEAIRQYGKDSKKIKGIVCPTCGSSNVQKIGTLERTTSVVGMGIASKKINKTFKCNKCGYTW